MPVAMRRHSRWGLANFESLRNYHMNTADQIIEFTPRIWATARDAINAVSKVADAHTKEDISKMANQVTLKMLYQILTLMHSMEGIYRLAEYPSIATGCIKLLSTIKPTPFCYEYGYLCYNILELTVGACLLHRSQGSGTMEMNLLMHLMPDAAPVMEFSEQIDGVVEEEIEFMLEENEPEYTDWNLGWADFRIEPRKVPLISLSDARSLLMHLWEDRRSLFGLISISFSPCMSALALILWRFVRHMCIVKKEPSSKLLVQPFAEILWRFILGASSAQQGTLCYLLKQIDELPGIWKAKYTPVDPADSNMILVKYCRLLESPNPDFPQHISIAAMPGLLNFVTAMTLPGSGINDASMFPEFYRTSVRRLWEAVQDEDSNRDLLINCIYAVFRSFGTLLDPIHSTKTFYYGVISEILKGFQQNDFMDLVARSIIMLSPESSQDLSALQPLNPTAFLQAVDTMFKALGKAAPLHTSTKFFRSYVTDWLKYRYRFNYIVGERLDVLCSRQFAAHYVTCSDTWIKLAQYVGQKEIIREFEETHRSVACNYPRCPDPSGTVITQLFCAKCIAVVYCSPRCQN